MFKVIMAEVVLKCITDTKPEMQEVGIELGKMEKKGKK